MKEKSNREVELYVIKPYERLPCECKTFNVKGKKAYSEDFGCSVDSDRENKPDYGCGCREFLAKEPTKEILEKHTITERQYYEIAHALEEKLYVGRCALCS